MKLITIFAQRRSRDQLVSAKPRVANKSSGPNYGTAFIPESQSTNMRKEVRKAFQISNSLQLNMTNQPNRSAKVQPGTNILTAHIRGLDTIVGVARRTLDPHLWHCENSDNRYPEISAGGRRDQMMEDLYENASREITTSC